MAIHHDLDKCSTRDEWDAWLLLLGGPIARIREALDLMERGEPVTDTQAECLRWAAETLGRTSILGWMSEIKEAA